MLFIKYIFPFCYLLSLFGIYRYHVATPTPQKTTWEIYYGEVNSVYSYIQVNDTNFVLNKLEFLFIDEHQQGYMTIDTSSVLKGDSLVPIKLEQLKNIKNGNKQFERIEKVTIDSNSFYIRLLESKRGTNLYRLQKNKKHYYTLQEFAIMKKDTLPVIWTGADSRTTKTRNFKTYLKQ